MRRELYTRRGTDHAGVGLLPGVERGQAVEGVSLDAQRAGSRRGARPGAPSSLTYLWMQAYQDTGRRTGRD